jgi:lysine 2,3-aminomutase
VAAQYALAITPDIVDLIDPADTSDPIARQFLPDPQELTRLPEESADPVGDDAHSPVEGIVHRYRDRVLLKPLHACAVYLPVLLPPRDGRTGRHSDAVERGAHAALAYIRERPEIWEVIVTGGDPLILSPRRLRSITAALGEMAHVRVSVSTRGCRWWTRRASPLPGARAESLRPGHLCGAARQSSARIHRKRLARPSPGWSTPVSRCSGQTVLLRGVNDDPATLGALMRSFVENRVKPYYLHHGDLAPGTPTSAPLSPRARRSRASCTGRLSGLCQPTYVARHSGRTRQIPPDAELRRGRTSQGRLSRNVAP